MSKKKNVYTQRRQNQDVNKKALIWIGACFAAIVVLMTVLLILDQ